MVRVTFYYKEQCWLCDQAEEMLNGLIERYDVKVDKINIESNDGLYELYRYDIPVLEFSDGTTLHGRFKKADLIRKLEQNKLSKQNKKIQK
jgi:hypothetical protein